MKTALDKIIDYKHDEVALLKSQTSAGDLLTRIKSAPPPRGFKASLDACSAQGLNALICEIKRKSPSAGDILKDADPVSIAQEYERAGAACLSVLTDFPSFGGTLDDLRAVQAAVGIPLLRKDFMIDPIQILEARANFADCILIILSAVDDEIALDLYDTAKDLGMDVLVEVHDLEELNRARKLGAGLVGVNNRNLKLMQTDLGVSEQLAETWDNHQMVSESGVKTSADILRLRKAGYSRFLIGESLMKETDRELFVRKLVETTKS